MLSAANLAYEIFMDRRLEYYGITSEKNDKFIRELLDNYFRSNKKYVKYLIDQSYKTLANNDYLYSLELWIE